MNTNKICNRECKLIKTPKLKFAICDDCVRYLTRLEKILREDLDFRDLTYQIDTFNDPDHLLDAGSEDYDVAFLDVYMPDKNGIEVGKQLRTKNASIVLVYISERLEFAPQGYEVSAFRYLMKDSLETSFKPCIEAILEILSKKKFTYPIKTDKGLYWISPEHIIYVESDKRVVTFYVQDEEREYYSCYGKLSDVEEKLSPYGFLRIHKSFLVNMEFIQYINNSHVTLKNHVELSISKQNSNELVCAYSLWRGRL